MKIRAIKNILHASLIQTVGNLNVEIDHIYASDLMSDVLAFGKSNSVLLTGLATQQAIIAAHMAEFKGIVFIRGKKPDDGSKEFAKNHEIILLTTNYDMYDACIKIGSLQNDTKKITNEKLNEENLNEILLNEEFVIHGNDFTNAGSVSTKIKSKLKKIGFAPLLIRRIAISTYEAEMNVVMHADQGNVRLSVTPNLIQINVIDAGKGIPDINMALQEGFTTATDEMRAMGFGSGMGLPNIKRNSDDLNIESTVGKGTKLEIKFFI
jgi:anti-sigma regulatory factor (Ser/Thr protein kinase)